jgi:hypothetical protein
VTFAAIGVTAAALADVTHEVLGHAMTAWLAGVHILSLSTVAIQTSAASRGVAAAGTVANVVVGALFLLIFNRTDRRSNWSYFCWVFAAFNLLNSGYLIVSALLGNGDWAAVIGGLSPAGTWRCALGFLGVGLYVGSVRWLARAMARRIERREIALSDLRRLVIAAYLAGGAILTIASVFNPISPHLILISGMGASFGLTAGLLTVPGVIQKRVTVALQTPSMPEPLSLAWVSVSIVVGIVFVAIFGPGLHFRT